MQERAWEGAWGRMGGMQRGYEQSARGACHARRPRHCEAPCMPRTPAPPHLRTAPACAWSGWSSLPAGVRLPKSRRGTSAGRGAAHGGGCTPMPCSRQRAGALRMPATLTRCCHPAAGPPFCSAAPRARPSRRAPAAAPLAPAGAAAAAPRPPRSCSRCSQQSSGGPPLRPLGMQRGAAAPPAASHAPGSLSWPRLPAAQCRRVPRLPQARVAGSAALPARTPPGRSGEGDDGRGCAPPQGRRGHARARVRPPACCLPPGRRRGARAGRGPAARGAQRRASRREATPPAAAARPMHTVRAALRRCIVPNEYSKHLSHPLPHPTCTPPPFGAPKSISCSARGRDGARAALFLRPSHRTRAIKPMEEEPGLLWSVSPGGAAKVGA
jgi:hypothetical protein